MTLLAVIISHQIEMFHKHKMGILIFGCTVGLFMFFAVGAATFVVVEGEEYEDSQKSILEAKEKIRKQFPGTTGESLDAFMEQLTLIGVRGLPKKNNTIVKWKFADAWFFVVTLLTTVGYGNFTPRTITGKVICMVYTSAGIPLTLLCLAMYVDILMKESEKYKAAMFLKYQEKIHRFLIRLVHTASVMSVIVLFTFIIPASIFACLEKDWGLFDGIYFCFISLTTVGLGDLVPAMDPEMPYADYYKIAASLFLLGGITLLMFMMAVFGDFVKNFKNDYQQLPFTIPTENFPINPGTMHTYGSILTQSGKSETDEKSIIPYDQLAT